MIKILDVLIIGSGPAGISLALYLYRAGISVMVIGNGVGSLEFAEKIENYYGVLKEVSGKELAINGVEQAKNLGINIINEEVVNILDYGNFEVITNSNSYKAKTIVFATGKSRNTLNVNGVKEFLGKGISYCATCDGFFYKNKKIAVIGNGNYALSELSELQHFTKDIVLFTNNKQITFDLNNIKIIDDEISEILGKEKVSAIKTKNNIYNIEGIFIALGTASANDFAKKLGILTENDNIIVNKEFATNVTGAYAIGDCIGGLLQIAKAVSDGANAAKYIIKYVKTKI